jgi:N-acetylglutamate synthase-like GNAT family acetyltransferase
MQTRQATADDAGDVRRVAQEAWEAAYDFLPEKEHEAAMRERYATDRLERVIADDEDEFVVAVNDGDVVGFVYADPVDPAKRVGDVDLRAIHVHPDHWEFGVRTAMLDHLEQVLGDRGFTQLEVQVFADAEDEQTFFENRGFERIEDRVADLLAGDTEPVYRYYHEFR